ncbi:beta-N-acetylglucosaminidase domain-containing protein [Amycolatopsis thailandensis]|uniref:beta-N-acetylglucosaminidase domain-containing protein n=1 Tax=Amycolatopsis thailandensis TaxID=589330 RepID=UPI001FC9DADE|nr:beta-N-acetylglucosaminidase domain-containing protein [Amycolatopsis thailandensis]
MTLLVTAVAVAVPAPVSAAPAPPSLAQVWPTPRQLTPRPGQVTIPRTVVEVAGADTDPSALAVVEQVLRSAGASTFVKITGDDRAAVDRQRGDDWLVVFIGGPTESRATALALAALRVEGPEGLSPGGYVLAADRGVIALSGVDTAGTFYAAQSFRQLFSSGESRAFALRDWPAAPMRGVIEGFYGAPWSHADRLAQLDFYGRTKQNMYVYSPKDDPYLRARWRDQYPPEQLAPLSQLVSRAAANHVEFTYALSPGLSVCYSSDADAAALVTKFRSLWDIGVRSFAIPLDDISYTRWNCDADAAKFGTGGAAAGAAQSFLLNRVQRDFIAAHPGAERLQMVPTEYYDLADSPYKTALRTQLDKAVIVEWTGVGVIAGQITEKQARQAKEVFGHDLLIWDNYPVNDYITERLLLGPYIGREPGVAKFLTGITANPMVQAEASKIAEFTSGDFLWNPDGYDPDKSWLAAIADLGGPAAPALKVFAENNYSSLLVRLETGKPDLDSPVLHPLLTAFWTALEKKDPWDAAAKLDRYLIAMAANPEELRRGMATNPKFLTEVGPWLDQVGLYGQAGRHAVKMLLAHFDGDGAKAWAERGELVAALKKAQAIRVPTARGPRNPGTCTDVCVPFLDSALATADRWFGLPGIRPRPTTSMGTYTDNVPARMVDGDPETYYWTDWAPRAGDTVGVDLGIAQQVSHVDITTGKPSSPNDFIHNGVLEYSADGERWTTVKTVTEPVISADLPEGAEARFVRLRVTGTQTFWVVVSEFTVSTPDSPKYTVTGTPAGPNLAAAADNNADSVYTAASAPLPGDALVITAAAPKPLDKVVVLAAEAGAGADVQIADAAGGWQTIGRMTGGYTELPARDVVTDRVRLLWTPGGAPPKIAEVVPVSPPRR